MERENQRESEEFDPSQSEEFLQNLEKAFETESEESNRITIEEPKTVWIEIKEDIPQKSEPSDESKEDKLKEKQEEEKIPLGDGLFPIEEEFRVDLSGIEDLEEEDSLSETEEFPPVSELHRKQREFNNIIIKRPNVNSSQENNIIIKYINSDPLEENEEEEEDKEEEEILQEITESLAETASSELEPPLKDSSSEEETTPKKKLPKFIVPLMAVAGSILLLCIFLFGTKSGQHLMISFAAKYAESRMNYDDGSNHEIQKVEDDVDITEEELENNPDITIIPEDQIQLGANEGEIRQEDEVINILLLGEEAIGSGSARGRTDLIIVATMNTKEKSFKLTSLMRDLLVEIPNHPDNKLNAAYQIGGIPLLYETIEHNFDLKIDGYCLVGFDDFESIIDLLGGIDISLTSAEANYLRKTNYISNPSNRNVKEGINHMNGNQALGYCRIRYVGTKTEINDFGRTQRHRIVLNTIFEKVKSLSYMAMFRLVNDCLPLITTDMKSSQITDYVEQALQIGLTEVENYRIPVEGTYEEGYVRRMAVLIPNIPKNVELLHEFIFGKEED